MPKYNKKEQETIRQKLHKMKNENKPRKQKIAIAISEAKK